MQQNIIHDVTKEYKDMFKVVVYRYGFDPYKNKEQKQEKKEKNKEESIHRSVRRSRSVINDYVLCNDFDMFATFTFNPRKVNRYDMITTYLKMQGWLERNARQYENFRYIVVPERHKDGAIHFHALLNGYCGELKKTNIIQSGKRVYNITGFRFGFTNVTILDDDKMKTIAYMCKYIQKDMELVNGKRRYWASKRLNKPVITHNTIWDTGIASLLSQKTLRYETEYSVVYEVSRDSLLSSQSLQAAQPLQ